MKESSTQEVSSMARGRKEPKDRLADQGFGAAAGCTARYGDDGTLPPPAVAEDPAAAECWERTVRALIEMNCWQATDRHLVQRLAIAHALCCALEPMLLAGKAIQRTKTGYEAVSAPLTCWTKASGEMGRIEKALGLTPTERAHQKVVPADEDELTQFLTAIDHD